MVGSDRSRCIDAPHPQSPGRPPTRRNSSKPDATRSSILLVEDTLSDAALIRRLLARRFPNTAVNVARTLAAATKRLPGDTELILLDLGLPDGRGLEAATHVLDAAQGIPIVILTGTDDADLAERCLEHGVQDYVAKQTLDERTLGRAVGYARARSRAQRMHLQLQCADRLATIGRLVSAVAHEVNNPAAFIRLNTEEMLYRIEEFHGSLAGLGHAANAESLDRWLEDTRAILSDNLDGIQRITQLIRDLKPLTKTKTRHFELVDVAGICRSTIETIEHRVRPHATLRLQLEQGPPVLAAPDRLGQAIANLVLNAAQSIEGPAADNEVVLMTSASRKHVVITVRDTGGGIPAGLEAKIFEPFYSTKSAQNNTGLGLSISQEIVQSFGGELELQRTDERGSSFSIRLPVADLALPAPLDPPAPQAPLTPRRILLIDDDPKVLEALGRRAAHHHEVCMASSGDEALTLLRRDDRFDAIVCDMMMPGLDGAAVIEQLRARHPALAERVIVLSGGALTPRTTEFINDTTLPVLTKPVSLEVLLETIERAARAPGRA